MFVQIGSYRINLDQVAYIYCSPYVNQHGGGTTYYFNFMSGEGGHELDFKDTDIPEVLKEYLDGKITRLRLQETLWGV